MVYKKISKSKAVRRRRKNYSWLFLILLIMLVATITIVLGLLFTGTEELNIAIDGALENLDSTNNLELEDSEQTKVKPDKIDFQPVVNEWTKTVSGNKSVLIYDLDRDEIAAEYNIEEDYNTASLYKLFVVYEGYRMIQNNEWEADDSAGFTDHTVLECLDLAIRESNSVCAETLHKMIGYEELEKIVKDGFKIKNTSVEGLESNVVDITEIMKLFYTHPDILEKNLIATMQDSFLNQPAAEYDWRQGLPSGFSDKVNVYNKVGWDYNESGYWNVYHDAAIIEFPVKDRHFIVVVMTNRVPYQKIRDLGTKIEEAFYNS